jgi:hypothetical protein
MARARSRKRRPTGVVSGPPTPAASAPRKPDSAAKAGGGAGAGGRARGARTSSASRAARSSPTAPTYGERPHAPWHPLPLSELLILIGAIGAALGLSKLGHGISSGGPALLAGLGAVALGTIEVTFREHRSGHRSHTVMLALMVVLVFDSAVVLVLTSFTTLPRLFGVGLLIVDVALFAFLFKLLRARFLEARHARVLREG